MYLCEQYFLIVNAINLMQLRYHDDRNDSHSFIMIFKRCVNILREKLLIINKDIDASTFTEDKNSPDRTKKNPPNNRALTDAAAGKIN